MRLKRILIDDRKFFKFNLKRGNVSGNKNFKKLKKKTSKEMGYEKNLN